MSANQLSKSGTVPFFLHLSNNYRKISKKQYNMAWCSSSQILAIACDEISIGLQRNEKNKDRAAYFSWSKMYPS